MLAQRLIDAENSRSCIMRNKKGYSSRAKLYPPDFAQFVCSLLVGDAVNSKAALGIVHESEILARLFNGDDIHEASRICSIVANLAIYLDETLHDNRLSLAAVQGILQSVAEENDERKAVTQLMRTRRGTRSIGTRELIKKPM